MRYVAFKKINTNKIFIRDIDFLPNFNKLILIWVFHFKEHLENAGLMLFITRTLPLLYLEAILYFVLAHDTIAQNLENGQYFGRVSMRADNIL